MATVRDLLAKKGNRVWTITEDASVMDAARIMNEHKIGALVVTAGAEVVGIFSERDVLRRVVVERRDPVITPVADVMTREVFCGTMETSIEEARSAMKTRRIRHLPVVDEQQQLLGLISIGDLNAHDIADHEQTIYLMNEYLYGRV
jgi:CBS domain-containing protein